MNKKNNIFLLYRIAKYYYIDNLTQEKIAKKENFSRTQISRMLDKARELGIVSVKVNLPNSEQYDFLEKKLKELLNLEEVSICPASDDINNELETSNIISKFAATELKKYLVNSKNIGIGWGYTLYQISKQIEPWEGSNKVTFIPLIGLSGESSPHYQVNIINNMFADKCLGNAYYTILSVMQDKQKLTDIENKSLENLIAKWKSIDTAIVAIGKAPCKGYRLIDGSKEYNEFINESGAVGDILANFFYEDGTICDATKYYWQVSYPVEELKKLNNVICISGGIKKVDALVIAARNHFYNKLITDANTAELMIEKILSGN